MLTAGRTIRQKEDELEGIRAVRQLSELPFPAETSVSIITPPKVRVSESPASLTGPGDARCSQISQVTLGILEQAKALSIPALWLQPGAEDAAVIKYVDENGLADRVVYACILVEGDGVIKSLQ